MPCSGPGCDAVTNVHGIASLSVFLILKFVCYYCMTSCPDLTQLDPDVYLKPFLDVIKSEDTTGPITGVALSSVHKFLSYGSIGMGIYCTLYHILLIICLRSDLSGLLITIQSFMLQSQKLCP